MTASSAASGAKRNHERTSESLGQLPLAMA
jgi:hypothetical protein